VWLSYKNQIRLGGVHIKLKPADAKASIRGKLFFFRQSEWYGKVCSSVKKITTLKLEELHLHDLLSQFPPQPSSSLEFLLLLFLQQHFLLVAIPFLEEQHFLVLTFDFLEEQHFFSDFNPEDIASLGSITLPKNAIKTMETNLIIYTKPL